MERKVFEFKIDEIDEAGVFTGYASVWDVVDFGRDKVVRGAFKKTLKEKRTLPLLWSHDSSEPLGSIVEAEEDDRGLKIKGKLVLAIRKAAETCELMRAKVVSGLSIGYDAIKREWEEDVRILKEVKLWEISLCVFPMLDDARVTSVKTADPIDQLVSLVEETKQDVAAGRVLSGAKLQDIRKAARALALLADREPPAKGTPGNQEPPQPNGWKVVVAELERARASLQGGK